VVCSLVSGIAFWRLALASMIHPLPLRRPTLAYLPGHSSRSQPYGLRSPPLDRHGRRVGSATCLFQQKMIMMMIKLAASKKGTRSAVYCRKASRLPNNFSHPVRRTSAQQIAFQADALECCGCKLQQAVLGPRYAGHRP
jgi:hypothetical protein